MPKLYTDIVDDAEGHLQDSTNTVFEATEFDSLMPDGLRVISQARPWNPLKVTKTTTIDSYDITLSTGDKWRLLNGSGYKGTGIIKAEYPVDKNPAKERGVTRYGDIISLEVSSRPSTAESVYLFMNKIHLLPKQIGTTDTAGAIKTQAAIGATSVALKGLGTGTIEEQVTLAITGDSTVYYVISQATIGTNEATVNVWPPIAAVAAVDTVVTLSLTESTLDYTQESHLGRWLAAKAAISKATLSYQQVNTAVTTIANAVTAVSAIAARITQAITDMSSGRTEAAKVSAILDTANTEIDKILARLTQASIDIAEGRMEADKVAPIVAAANTALDAVAARITQSLTDIASGRTAISLGKAAISDAEIQMGLADPQVDLAVTALSTANGLLNTIPRGGGAQDYFGQAQADLATAQGFALTGQTNLQLGSANFNNANLNFTAANREIDAGITKIREAQAGLEVANVDMTTNRAFIEQCIAQLRMAQGYFQEAQGYVMEANTRMANTSSFMSIANGELNSGRVKAQEVTANLSVIGSRLQMAAGGRNWEAWGRQELAKVEVDIRVYGAWPCAESYKKD